MKKWLVIAATFLAALVIVHNPPRAAQAQSGGGTTQYLMGSIWNGAAPVISANLFSTSLYSYATKPGTINPQQVATTMTIGVSLKVTGVLYAVESNGTTTQVTALNGGTALTAFQDYTFTRAMRSQDASGHTISFNFQLGTNGGVNYLRVQEVVGGVD